MKAPITERALFARVDRHLAKQGERLRRARAGSKSFETLGQYYVVNQEKGTIQETKRDLESLAREYGLLAEWEELEN